MKINIWPTKKLGEVLDYEQPGKYIVNTKSYRDDYKTPVLTAGKTFILGHTNEKDNVFPIDELPVIIFDDFTTAIKFVDFPFKVKSSAMKILHAKRGKADIKFLFYAMKTMRLNHHTHKRYWISEYSKKQITLPPLIEQKKIVGKIEKLFAKIDEAQKLREEAKFETASLFQSTLNEIFEEGKLKGWEEVKLSQITEKIDRIDPKKHFRSEFSYIDISSVRFNNDTIMARNIPINKAPSRARQLVKKSDTIFATTRPYLKHIAIIPDNLSDSVASTGFCIIRGKADIVEPRYLYNIVMSDYFVEKIIPFQKGATYPAVSDSIIFNQIIPLPSIAEQKKIVARLDKLTEKVREMQKLQAETAAEMKNLKQSILAKAFKGEL